MSGEIENTHIDEENFFEKDNEGLKTLISHIHKII